MAGKGLAKEKAEPAATTVLEQGCGETEWWRLARDGPEEVGLLVHVSLLGQYIRSGMRVLEVGPGPGQCTKLMGVVGCWIVAADSSHVRLRHHAIRARAMGFAQAVEGRLQVELPDLHPFRAESFDAVVCYLGPICCELPEAGAALKECVRVCRPGGFVMVSVLSLWGALGRYVESGEVPFPPGGEDGVPQSWSRGEGWYGVSHRCQIFRARELRKLAKEAGLGVLALSASNALSTGWENLLRVEGSDDELLKELVQLELKACRDEGNLDMGTHIILVGSRA